jgi:hypothetical protein
MKWNPIYILIIIRIKKEFIQYKRVFFVNCHHANVNFFAGYFAGILT